MPRYISIGHFTIDRVILPNGTDMPRQIGGACPYAAMGIRLWCPDVGLVSVISAEYPHDWLKMFESARFDIAGIQSSSRKNSIESTMRYKADGSRSAVLSRTYPPDWSAEQILREQVQMWYDYSPQPKEIPEAYFGAEGAHIAPMPVSRQNEYFKALHHRIACVTSDPPWWSDVQERDDHPSFNLTSAILPSEAELQGYFGSVTDREGALRLAALGAKLVVIKKAAEGSLVYDSESRQWWKIPAYVTKVIDPTGAGDAFCGGFLVGLVETGDPFEAALYGTVSASFVIEGFGVFYSLQFNRSDAEARRTQLRSMAKKIT
jgi:sugar/nucleoside kinase (ribokinase family)